jgi:G:T/U-mismatch repair DNA glycosylase
VWRAAGYATLVLPSTSPAYTLPFAAKLAAWRSLRQWL